MTPKELVDDLRERINPVYANQIGTESYERRLCAEAIESLILRSDDWCQGWHDAVDEREAAYSRITMLEQQRDELLTAAELVLAWYEVEDDHSKEPDFYKRIEMCRQSETAIRAAIANVKDKT